VARSSALVHTRKDIEKLFAALDAHADKVVDTAKEASQALANDEFGIYSRFRRHCDDFDTLAIVIEYRLKNLATGRDTALEKQFEELGIFVLTATLQTSLHFLKILSTRNELPLGSKDIFLGELRNLYRAKQMLELDKYRNKVSARAVKDIETAEEILSVIIERAPSLLQLEAVEAA
jgi:hypothetical protein